MSHLELRATLDADIARTILQPVVRRALRNVVEGAQRAAPPVGVWVTARDDRVRQSHVETDGQAVPDNLRFRLPARGGGVDLAQAPRDPDLPADQRYNCRCHAAILPRLLADSITEGDVQVNGTVVKGEAYTEFPRAAESEFGNTSGDEAARFMGKGLDEAAAKMRNTVSRQ